MVSPSGLGSSSGSSSSSSGSGFASGSPGAGFAGMYMLYKLRQLNLDVEILFNRIPLVIFNVSVLIILNVIGLYFFKDIFIKNFHSYPIMLLEVFAVLLVDDLADSGKTLIKSIKWLEMYYGFYLEQNIRTAVIWHKSSSKYKPDYYVDYLEDSPWIHMPYEKYESMKPEEIV